MKVKILYLNGKEEILLNVSNKKWMNIISDTNIMRYEVLEY